MKECNQVSGLFNDWTKVELDNDKTSNLVHSMIDNVIKLVEIADDNIKSQIVNALKDTTYELFYARMLRSSSDMTCTKFFSKSCLDNVHKAFTNRFNFQIATKQIIERYIK